MFSTDPKSCESHLAITLDKGAERITIIVKSQTIIYDESHPFEKDNLQKKTWPGKLFQKQDE